MENIQKLKVGLGIKILSILILISNVFSLLGFVTTLVMKDQIKEMGIPEIPMYSIIVGIIYIIAVTIAIILILKKKELGIYIYFIAVVANLTYSIVSNGFQPVMLISLVIPTIMSFFIWKNKEVFSN